MWKAYLRFDQKILSLFQESYLWLLDRTGVYVATIAFLIYAVIAAAEIAGGGPLWIWGPLLALVGLFQAPSYLMQDKAQNERFNLIAMVMECLKWLHYWNMFLFLAVVVMLLTLDAKSLCAQIGFLAYGYMQLVKIRDRDKKPFFEKAPELAMQHHGSN